jgi:mRNA-degrading endonuclease toxin of MazEF toxin-antitoxin module
VFGEIFICQFPFTSGEFSKPRPALVLFDLGEDALIYRVTSVLRSGPLDASIVDWSVAGLARASVARLDRLVTAEKSILKKRLGVLSVADKATVRRTWNEHMRL